MKTIYAYYDREGNLQSIIKPKVRMSKSHPADAFSIVGFVSKSQFNQLPNYNPSYNVSDVMDLNGYMKNV